MLGGVTMTLEVIVQTPHGPQPSVPVFSLNGGKIYESRDCCYYVVDSATEKVVFYSYSFEKAKHHLVTANEKEVKSEAQAEVDLEQIAKDFFENLEKKKLVVVDAQTCYGQYSIYTAGEDPDNPSYYFVSDGELVCYCSDSRLGLNLMYCLVDADMEFKAASKAKRKRIF